MMALPPFSSSRLPHFLLGFFLLAVAPTVTTSQPLYQFCRPTDANYTANSTFQSNLNRLLPSLAANGSSIGFFNGTAGDAPDRVYGLVLCRGDVATGPCRTCLATAAEGIVQNCPLKKSSVVWYDYCMLRYSNVLFFSVPDDTLKVYLRNANSLSEVIQFNRQLARLMAALVQYAVYNNAARLFATGEAEFLDPTPRIYGLVQCTMDQSADDCNACLTGIVGEIPNMFSQWRGARILKATCNFRYELYPFYNGSGMLSVPLAENATPPPATLSPPTEGQNNSTGTVLAIVIPVVAALAVISIMCFCFYRRHAEKKKLIYTMEKIAARCTFGDDVFIFFIRRDMTVDQIREEIFRRWSLSGCHWSIMYLLPGSINSHTLLSVNDDVKIMLELHRMHECRYILMEVSCKE